VEHAALPAPPRTLPAQVAAHWPPSRVRALCAPSGARLVVCLPKPGRKRRLRGCYAYGGPVPACRAAKAGPVSAVRSGAAVALHLDATQTARPAPMLCGSDPVIVRNSRDAAGAAAAGASRSETEVDPPRGHRFRAAFQVPAHLITPSARRIAE
jgi:hypothetical protein